MFRLIVKLIDDILWPAVFIVFFWLIFFANEAYNLHLQDFGVRPRSIHGLIGILSMPFLHGDFEHLFSNTIPFFVSGTFIFHFFDRVKWKIILIIWYFSGLGIWVFGDPMSIHIGASGLVYGMVAFLMTSGFIRKNKELTAVALVLIFLYGSMVWGLFPQFSWFREINISWEGHLFGTLSGVALALFYRKEGPADDPDPFEENDDPPQWWVDMENERLAREQPERYQPPQIRIIYKPKDRDKNDSE